MINESEMEDYKNIISNSGLDVDDFLIQEQKDPMIGTEVQPITETITIRRKSTGKEKTYKAGHGSAWPAEFSDDLTGGIFN